MQGKDPFLALLGLFILATTFFFCGKGVVTSPPPVALESQTAIPPPAPNISESPPSSPTAPPVSEPMGLSGKIGEPLIGHSIIYRINSTPLLPEEDTPSNRAATMPHEASIVVFHVDGHTGNAGFWYVHEVLSERHVQADVEDLLSQRVIVNQLTPSGFRMSRPVAWHPVDEWGRQHRRLEWFIGTKGELP